MYQFRFKSPTNLWQDKEIVILRQIVVKLENSKANKTNLKMAGEKEHYLQKTDNFSRDYRSLEIGESYCQHAKGKKYVER